MARKDVDLKYNFIGASRDTNIELGTVKDGTYYDAKNMRPSSTSGYQNAMEEIKGELEVYDLTNDSLLTTYSGYKSIGATRVKGHSVVIYASDLSNPSFIQIDDEIVCLSDKLPFVYTHPLQIDINESCRSGEIFLTDFNSVPMYFDIQDMIDNVGTTKYFDDFNPSLYTIQNENVLNIPVFKELTDEGINGLMIGKYCYSIRYVDDEGNRTMFSKNTPLIPVPENVGRDIINRVQTDAFLGKHTYGGFIGELSTYGIKIKFRVVNNLDYNYIEVKRAYYNSGQPLGSTPIVESYQIPRELVQGEISVWEFTDVGDLDWTALSDVEETEVLSAIKSAKTIRYYDGRIVLMNVNYESRDIDGEIDYLETAASEKIFPFVDNIGAYGHKEIYNAAYKMCFGRDEAYNLGVVYYDSNGTPSFCDTVEENFKFPARRERVTGASLTASETNWKGVPYATDITNANNQPTYDVIDNLYAYEKDDLTAPFTVSIDRTDYNPLTPINKNDTSTHLHYNINEYISTDPSSVVGSKLAYSPKLYNNNNYALGGCLRGVNNKLDSFPSWIKSFSVVRSKPAGKLIAQGLGMYALRDNDNNITAQTSEKGLNQVIFYSEDVDKLGIEPTVGMTLRLSSPMGYFSEMYAGERPTVGWDRGIDLVTYANVMRVDGVDSATTFPAMQNYSGSYSFWTRFGEWRNQSFNTTPIDYTITGVVQKAFKDVGRSNWYLITLDKDIYETQQSQTSGLVSAMEALNDAQTIAWQEPFYICNLYDEDVEISDNNINQYIETEHYQKIESVIGKVSALPTQSFELIDERFEDCIVNNYSPSKAVDTAYLYIRDSSGSEQAWINVQYRNTAFTSMILNDIETNGYYVSVDGIKCYGVYFHDWGADDREFNIIFKQPALYGAYSNSSFLPTVESLVVVKYDNRFPVKFFGGDVHLGESCFAPIDGTSTDKGDVAEVSGRKQQFYSFVGYPYPVMWFDDDYKVLKNARSPVFYYQSVNDIKMQRIRQMIVMFTSESRAAVNLFAYISSSDGISADVDSGIYSSFQSYPAINYVQRPQDWDSDNFARNFEYTTYLTVQGRIGNDYTEDFPEEHEYWQYGGFKFSGINNIDYAHSLTDKTFITKPTVGFEEKTAFCSRITFSKQRLVNVQDSPSLKTFPAINVYDIEDEQGAIKYAFDADSSKGNNLYAITSNGVCLLLTNKQILTDLTGGNIGYVNSDNMLIQNHYWLLKGVGMPDEMWRSAAEYTNSLYWASKKSAYLLLNNEIKDIGVNEYFSRLNPKLSIIDDGYKCSVEAAYDSIHGEYWLQINSGLDEYSITLEKGIEFIGLSQSIPSTYNDIYRIAPERLIKVYATPDNMTPSIWMTDTTFVDGEYIVICNKTGKNLIILSKISGSIIVTIPPNGCRTITRDVIDQDGWVSTGYAMSESEVFVYNPSREHWTGHYTYRYDKYLYDETGVYGVRGLKTYKTDEGYLIEDNALESVFEQVSNKDNYYGKEFEEVRVNTLFEEKPTSVEFFINGTRCCYLSDPMNGSANPYYLKSYNGYTNKIPRKFETDDNRVQGRHLLYKVRHTADGNPYIIISTAIKYKILRLN